MTEQHALISSYAAVKTLLVKQGFEVNPYRDMGNYLQFIVFLEDKSGIIQIKPSDNGPIVDLSLVDQDDFRLAIEPILGTEMNFLGRLLEFDRGKKTPEIPDTNYFNLVPKTDPAKLIGLEEAGIGDYFGPITVAAVLTDEKSCDALAELKLLDKHHYEPQETMELAKKIKELCPHSVIMMRSASYNDLFAKMQSLNHILAWAQERVIESVARQGESDYVLSSQFGNKALIDATLFSKGIKLSLYHRPNADDNVSVKAARLLAQAAVVECIKDITLRYGQEFPRGTGENVMAAAKDFVKDHGPEMLVNVAKVNFSMTKELLPEETK